MAKGYGMCRKRAGKGISKKKFCGGAVADFLRYFLSKRCVLIHSELRFKDGIHIA